MTLSLTHYQNQVVRSMLIAPRMGLQGSAGELTGRVVACMG
jgi:hypothetical protein